MRTLVTLVIVGLVLLGGGFLISQSTPLLFPPQASAEAEGVDNLFKLMLFIGGAIFLLVQGALVYSVWRFRAKPGDTSDGPAIHGNTFLETIWTAFPAVIVLVLTVLAYQVWVNNRAEKSDELVAHVQGARFAWTFAYDVPVTPLPADVLVADLPASLQADIADDGIITINSSVLHTYVGRSVMLEMRSDDVIHAFWIPAMRIKQDVIPGRLTEIRFTPILAGEYPVVCAELCGGGHGQMRVPAGIIVHEDETAYNAWLEDAVFNRLHPPDDPVLRGRQILDEGPYNCRGCHTLAEFGWQGVTGPNLNGVGDRAASVRATATGLTPYEYLQQSLHDPQSYLVPGYGPLMIVSPPLTEEDIPLIAAYLCTQTATGESACPEIATPEEQPEG
jgi:cytochrome c oxidase subunit 2